MPNDRAPDDLGGLLRTGATGTGRQGDEQDQRPHGHIIEIAPTLSLGSLKMSQMLDLVMRRTILTGVGFYRYTPAKPRNQR